MIKRRSLRFLAICSPAVVQFLAMIDRKYVKSSKTQWKRNVIWVNEWTGLTPLRVFIQILTYTQLRSVCGHIEHGQQTPEIPHSGHSALSTQSTDHIEGMQCSGWPCGSATDRVCRAAVEEQMQSVRSIRTNCVNNPAVNPVISSAKYIWRDVAFRFTQVSWQHAVTALCSASKYCGAHTLVWQWRARHRALQVYLFKKCFIMLYRELLKRATTGQRACNFFVGQNQTQQYSR